MQSTSSGRRRKRRYSANLMKAEMERIDVKGSRSQRWSSKFKECTKNGWSNEKKNDMRFYEKMGAKRSLDGLILRYWVNISAECWIVRYVQKSFLNSKSNFVY